LCVNYFKKTSELTSSYATCRYLLVSEKITRTRSHNWPLELNRSQSKRCIWTVKKTVTRKFFFRYDTAILIAAVTCYCRTKSLFNTTCFTRKKI